MKVEQCRKIYIQDVTSFYNFWFLILYVLCLSSQMFDGVCVRNFEWAQLVATYLTSSNNRYFTELSL